MTDGPAEPPGNAPRMLRLDVRTTHGRIQGNLPVPPGDIRLPELAFQVIPLAEKLGSMAAQAAVKARERPISCAKGCSACCHQIVPVSGPEAWLLLDLVASFPKERRKAVLERFAEARARIAASELASGSLGAGSTRADVKAMAAAYFRLRIPCPFLGGDGACTIHPYRPNACREFLVTSPAANCADPGALPVESVARVAGVAEALAAVASEFLGSPPVVMPLTSALDWAAEHGEEGRRAFDAAGLMSALMQALFPVAAEPPPGPAETTAP